MKKSKLLRNNTCIFRARMVLLACPLILVVACKKTPEIDEPNDKCPLSDARLTRMEEKYFDSTAVTEYFYDNSRRIVRLVNDGTTLEYEYFADSAILLTAPGSITLREINDRREVIRSTVTSLRGTDTLAQTVHEIFYSGQIGQIDSIQTHTKYYSSQEESRVTRRFNWFNGNVQNIVSVKWATLTTFFSPDTAQSYEYYSSSGNGRVPGNWDDIFGDLHLNPRVQLVMNTSLWKTRIFARERRDSVVVDAFNKVLSYQIRPLHALVTQQPKVTVRFRYECW